MFSSTKPAVALSVICLLEFIAPAFAQLSSTVDSLDEVGSPRSKIADVDIVTNSPTLQSSAPMQQSTLNSSQWNTGAVPMPQQAGMVQQNTFAADTTQYPAQYPAQYPTSVQTSAVSQTASKPIQVDSQTVGRVVGVAGTALLLGAFLKNGGVGGMMNTFGLDNRFHSRGSSLAPY